MRKLMPLNAPLLTNVPLSNAIRKAARQDEECRFPTLVAELASSVHPTTIAECKRKTVDIGNSWEDFSKWYLMRLHGWTVWTLKECPFLLELGLKTRDMGIDLIAREPQRGDFVAIQCKFRKSMHRLSWRDVATFDALCMRTGPWRQRVIITTSKSIHREGFSLPGDVFWGCAHFQRLTRSQWMDLCGFTDGFLCGTTTDGTLPETLSSLREKRLQKFQTQIIPTQDSPPNADTLASTTGHQDSRKCPCIPLR